MPVQRSDVDRGLLRFGEKIVQGCVFNVIADRCTGTRSWDELRRSSRSKPTRLVSSSPRLDPRVQLREIALLDRRQEVPVGGSPGLARDLCASSHATAVTPNSGSSENHEARRAFAARRNVVKPKTAIIRSFAGASGRHTHRSVHRVGAGMSQEGVMWGGSLGSSCSLRLPREYVRKSSRLDEKTGRLVPTRSKLPSSV